MKETCPTIKIYFTEDGKAVIRYPAGLIPDSESVKRVSQILNREALHRQGQ